jgi:molybdate transport system ATP-binding protein
MIRAQIIRRFPAFQLSIEFEAASGVTALYGPSGAGKTLTLDALSGFVTPDAGRILFNDRIVFDAEANVNIPPRDRNAGYVFQDHALFPHMTVRDNLVFAAHKLARLERHRRITEVLDRFHLTDLAARKPRELSGGQKQRASIARALIADPAVLLLDEPSQGLDINLRAELFSTVTQLRRQLDIPVILVTHDLEECFALADRVLIYEHGSIIHRGTPVELLRNPASAQVAGLMGGFNVYEAEVVSLDPGKQSSRIQMLGSEMNGPHLRGVFKGDRVLLCVRPEELQLATSPGPNRVRADLQRVTERPQSLQVDFGDNLIVDVPRADWRDNEPAWWVEIPAASLRQISRAVSPAAPI